MFGFNGSGNLRREAQLLQLRGTFAPALETYRLQALSSCTRDDGAPFWFQQHRLFSMFLFYYEFPEPEIIIMQIN